MQVKDFFITMYCFLFFFEKQRAKQSSQCLCNLNTFNNLSSFETKHWTFHLFKRQIIYVDY